MLRSLSEIRGYKIEALDDGIGKVDDFLFDDQRWTVRYIVVDTGRWLPGRQVLVSPASAARPEHRTKQLPLNLVKEAVEASPSLSTDEPVSRQHERALSDHYGWAPYWRVAGATALATGEAPPSHPTREMAATSQATTEQEDADPNLRSAREVKGYHILAADGEIGHVEDFILDDVSWTIRYLVIDTRNWLPGRKVLVAPLWIDGVSWPDRQVRTQLTQDEIKDSPEYDSHAPVNRAYEERLYDYYGRPQYWL